MDTSAPWPQDVVMKPPMEAANSLVERKVRAHKEQAFNCPRCNSTNTKFCYYNNYSLSQPRFFCKSCRRYWTQGGSLRNIPVGGGSRKNKRPTTSSPSPCHTNKLPSNHLAPPRPQNPNPSSSSSLPSRVMYDSYSFVPLPVVGSGFHHLLDHDHDHHFNKSSSSSLSFSLEHGSDYGVFQGLQDNNDSGDKLVFPFEDLNQDQDQDRDHPSTDEGGRQIKDHDHQDGDPSNGFWSGVIGGGSW